jgi:hypothetical protein
MLTSSIGWVLGLAGGFAVGFAYGGTVGGIASQGVFGAVLGASIGMLQWVVLRRQISRAGWWVLATTLGMGGGFALIRAMTPRVSLLLGGGPLYGTANGGLFGILVGTLQGLVLRRQVARAGWWVLTSAVAMSVGFALDQVVGQLVGIATTGTALVWLLREPAQGTGPREAANDYLRRRK